MPTSSELNSARDRVRQLLSRYLGPELRGVNAFGVSFDRATGQRVVRVDLDPLVAAEIRELMPHMIGNVEIRVEQGPPARFD